MAKSISRKGSKRPSYRKSKVRAKLMGIDGLDVSLRRKMSKKGSRKAKKMSCGSGMVRVKGYTRADGSRVKAHCSRVGKRKASRKGSRK